MSIINLFLYATTVEKFAYCFLLVFSSSWLYVEEKKKAKEERIKKQKEVMAEAEHQKEWKKHLKDEKGRAYNRNMLV